MAIEKQDQDSLDAIKGFYNSVYYKDKNVGLQPAAHLQKLAKRLGVSPAMQVLDVACGMGEWLKVCQLRGAFPCGVDIAEKAIEICKANLREGEFFSQPAETLPFENARFDVVTCLGSLEHFVQPQQALEAMVRVAKPDAVIVLLVPNADFLTRKLGLYGGTYQVDAKEEVRTLEAWQQLFASAGLQVEERWKDLHVLSWSWICLGKWYAIPARIAQALLLMLWPLRWQYQVYHRCSIIR
jgi:2-polyprenyl-3-methyl-5-hydroxy-6-metoxy-1,4-benzoquinol methylase